MTATRMTEQERCAAAAALIRKAMRLLREAEAVAPDGECYRLEDKVLPWAEAMERGAAVPAPGRPA